MNILYCPCHAILEFDQYKLWTEMGHTVFSFGSYVNPASPHDPIRPPLKGKFIGQLVKTTEVASKNDLHDEMIKWADIIIIDHDPFGTWIPGNWEKIKHKPVILRTIGQNVGHNEDRLHKYRAEGLKIVRYSPMEYNLPGFAGADKIIRFYKDENEFCNWLGDTEEIITFIQNAPARYEFVNFKALIDGTKGLNATLYGPLNENVTDIKCGGKLTYQGIKDKLRMSRVFFYTGTHPASYTLAFIEAMMTGIPIVSIGHLLGNSFFKLQLWEIQNIIQNGVDGYVFDDIKELHFYSEELLKNKPLAMQIGAMGRKKAIGMFGKEVIKKDWLDFFNSLS
jgi:glycosyltransferase involved in cell wall biosynthesis